MTNKEASQLFFKYLKEETPDNNLLSLFSDGKGFDIDINSSPQYKLSIIKEAFDKFIEEYNKPFLSLENSQELNTQVLYKLTKLIDNRQAYSKNDPNFIPEGYTEIGVMRNRPIIGDRFCIGRSFITSTVLEINAESANDVIFKTKNSTYKLEKC